MRKVNYWLYFISIFALSQASVITRWSQSSIEVLGFWRLLFSVILLRLLFMPREFFKGPQKLKVMLYVLGAGVFLYLHFWTFFYAAQNTSIANTTLLFCLNPVTTSLVAWFFLKDRLTWKVLLSYAFGLMAVVTLFVPYLGPSPGNASGNSWADLSALISAVFYSVYIVMGKRGQQENVSGPQFTSLTFLVAGFLFLIHVSFFLEPEMLLSLSSRGWMAVGLLTLLPTLLGHALFLILSRKLNINWMSAGKLFEPPLAAVSAFLVFSQTPTSTALVSFVFLVPSLVFLVFSKNKP